MKRALAITVGTLLLASLTAGAPAGTGAEMGRYTGALYNRETGTLDLVLYQGTRYYYSGTCDYDCRDLDFVLEEWVPPYNGRRGYWRFVVSDRAANDTPSFSVTPGYDTTFRLSIFMARCNIEPCGYDVYVSP
ncbi:MAG TPA: hypothetical protein VFT45_22500 [Longimicrobium sp.]|nr:hypothetical protein [Longimicrobium sp.]